MRMMRRGCSVVDKASREMGWKRMASDDDVAALFFSPHREWRMQEGKEEEKERNGVVEA